MSKKSYMSLLKEAIAEFDTSDNVDVKGPMLDPILSWDGDGELPVYKDAASILERYYFDEKQDAKIRTLESDYENDNGKPDKGPSMKDTEGAGTSQAGTSKKGMDKHEEEIAKEAEDMSDDAGDDADVDAVEEKALGKESVKAKKYTDEGEELEMENAIIEKLIAEMEDEDDDDDEDDDEDEKDLDEAEVMSYTGDEPKVSMPKEKKAKGPEEDTEGAGTEQAGTGTDAGQIPDRKDRHDQMVKPKKYTDENTQIEEALAALEAEMADDAEEDADEEVEKDLDVDKEMTKEAASAVPGGPSPKKRGEDWEEDEAAYSEAFNIFKEAIKEQDEEEVDVDVEDEEDED